MANEVWNKSLDGLVEGNFYLVVLRERLDCEDDVYAKTITDDTDMYVTTGCYVGRRLFEVLNKCDVSFNAQLVDDAYDRICSDVVLGWIPIPTPSLGEFEKYYGEDSLNPYYGKTDEEVYSERGE